MSPVFAQVLRILALAGVTPRDKAAEIIKALAQRFPMISKVLRMPGAEPYAFCGKGFPAPQAVSRMHELIASHEGRLVHKWAHYPPIYDKYLQPFVGQPVRVLEIGVSQGGSLELLRKYLGQRATIFGIDIDERCASIQADGFVVEIGSQADPNFLRLVVQKMNGIDIVIDDGSHIAEHQWISFQTLFPLLSEMGIYIIEDLHASYWPGFFQGGYRRAGTMIERSKSLVDHMHHWYHQRKPPHDWMKTVTGVHFHDSIVVVEKGSPQPPVHAKIGERSY